MGDRFEFKVEPLPRVLRRGVPSKIFQKVVSGPIDQMATVLQVNLEKASPVGATGTRLILTALKQLRRTGKGRALATLCVGGGQGAAIVLEAA